MTSRMENIPCKWENVEFATTFGILIHSSMCPAQEITQNKLFKNN